VQALERAPLDHLEPLVIRRELLLDHASLVAFPINEPRD
jgi:hypothetical protein